MTDAIPETAFSDTDALIRDIIELIKAQPRTHHGMATTLTALEYVVAHVLVTLGVPLDLFIERVHETMIAKPWTEAKPS